MSTQKSTLVASLLSVLMVSAQAKNTNEDWKWASEYYATYSEWTVGCDHRTDDESIKRCYLRYVDAYARNPFGALFVFVTDTNEAGLTFTFEYEAGVRFTKPWRVSKEDVTIWQFDPKQCPAVNECAITGEAAVKLAEMLNAEDVELKFVLRDRVFRSFELGWPSAGFADALADLMAQSNNRKL